MGRTSISTKTRLIALLAIAMTCVLFAFIALSTDLLENFENQTWDWRLRMSADPGGADPRIKIVVLDQRSLDYFEKEEDLFWPFPRVLYGLVVQYLTQAGAKGVAFDILFTERSSQYPAEDMEFVSMLDGAVPYVSAGEFQAISASPEFLSGSSESLDEYREAVASLRSKQPGGLKRMLPYLEKFPNLRSLNKATLPFDQLLAASPAIGNVASVRDEDGVVRRHVPVRSFFDVPVLSLPAAFLELLQPGRLPAIATDQFADEKGQFVLRFHGPDTVYEQISFSDVVGAMVALEQGEQPQISPDIFKDAWVFIGATAQGLKDDRPTPLSKNYAGVSINATVLDNLLHRNFFKKVSFQCNLFFSALLIVLTVTAVLFVPSVRIQFYLELLIFSVFLLLQWYALQAGYWLQVIVPLCSSTLGLIGAFAVIYKLEGKERAFIKNAFTHYLNPVVIDRIISDPSSLSLGGEKRELSIFFSDIAGFTSLSEQLDPRSLVLLLNKYLTALTDIVLENGGTLDKYEGDAIICFWNAPLQQDDHAFLAVKTALECQHRLGQLYSEFEQEFGVIPRTRIGINTGTASVGNFGSQSRFNYTVIGEAANLAARLEGLNKVFHTPILISEETRQQCCDRISCRRVGLVKAAGIAKPVVVYEPLEQLSSPASGQHATIKSFETAIMLFEDGRLDEALRAFRALDGDLVAHAYIQRLEKSLPEGGGLASEEWSPVWDLSDKNFLALLES